MGTKVVRIKLMGAPEIAIDGTPVRLPFRQADALIYYLAVTGSAAKTKLCDLLWGSKCTDEKAKSNLRNTVYVIRKAFGGDFIDEPARQTMALNPRRQIESDLQSYMEGEAPDWEDFLGGFYLKDNEEFSEWTEATARQVKEIYCRRLRERIAAAYDARDFTLCRSLCDSLTGADRYDEYACRRRMMMLKSEGKEAQAQKIYEELRKLLRDDLAQEPEAETTRLAREIKSRPARAARPDLGIETRRAAAEAGFFYGREAELANISRTLRLFMGNAPAASIVVKGEMGIGKSALMEEALRRTAAGDAALISARCYQAEESFLLKPWYDIFEQLLSSLSNDVSEEARTLRKAVTSLFPSADSVVAPADELFSAWGEYFLVRALVKYCAGSRLILKVDDIQWADPASLALIRNIVTMDKNRAILFVMGCRNDAPAATERLTSGLKLAGLLEEYDLERFTPEQTADFAKKFLPRRGFDAAFGSSLFRETEGNPLFITETLNNISFSGSLAGFTPKLGDVIRQRILGVEGEPRKALDLVSMMPDGAAFETLARISGKEPAGLVDDLEQLIERKLIREEAASGGVIFRFSHQKIREYTYENIPLVRRRLLHEKIALYFESTLAAQPHGAFVFPKLIYHFEKSRLLKKYLEYVIKNIIGYLNITQEYFPTGGDAAQPLILSGENGVSVLDMNNIESYFQSVERKITEDPAPFRDEEGQALLSEFYVLQARHYTHNLGYARARECIAKIREINGSCATAAQRGYILKANYHLSSICMDRMEIALLLRTADESARLAEIDGDRNWKAAWLRISGMSRAFAGNYGEAVRLLEEAAALFSSFGDTAAYRYSLCACYAWLGEAKRNQFDFTEAERWHERAVGLCREAEARGGAALIYTLYAQSLADSVLSGHECDEVKLRRVLKRARAFFDKFHLRWYRGVACAYSALAACKAGSYEEAADCLAEARAAAELLDSDYERCVADRVSAQIKAILAQNGEGTETLAALVNEDIEFYKERALRVTERLSLPIEKACLEGL